MRKTLVIASREYQASVRSKAFIISLVIMPVLMSAGYVLQQLFKDTAKKMGRPFAVIDRTPGEALWKVIKRKARTEPAYKIEHVDPGANDPARFEQRKLELSRRVENGELLGFVVIGAGVYPTEKTPFPPQEEQEKDHWAIRYQRNNPANDDFPVWVKGIVDKAVRKERCRLEARLWKPAQQHSGKKTSKSVPKELCQMATQVTTPIHLSKGGLSQETPLGKVTDAPEEEPFARFAVPFGLMMLMFMVVMIGATPLMQGIIEEKMQRIAEVLLGSVQPFELMMGKLLGMAGVSLTLVGIYLGGGYLALHHLGYAKYLPSHLLAWFLVFQVLSVFMYGSLFIAVGAACTDTKETQAMLMPVMLVVCMPFFILGAVLQDPESPLAEWMSFFPFATPMLMIVRQALVPHLDWWQPVLGAVLVLLTTLLCIYAAGRIFRVGLLMQGKGARFSDLVRWVFRG
jgi:ABC-2 type transport system permease protein